VRFNSSLQDLKTVADSLQDVTTVDHACYDVSIFWFESENIPHSRNRFIRYYQITKTLSWGLVALVKCFRASKVVDIREKGRFPKKSDLACGFQL